MGSKKAKSPDMSKQNEAAEAQTALLKKQDEEAIAAKEVQATENSEDLRAIRRRSRGRSSLIATSARGTEGSSADRAGDISARETEINRINTQGAADIAATAAERKAALQATVKKGGKGGAAAQSILDKESAA